MSFLCFPKMCGRDHLKMWELITAFRFAFTVFLGAPELVVCLEDALVAGVVMRFALGCAVDAGLGGHRLVFAVVVAVFLLVVGGASVEGGKTDGGDGPSATGSNDKTPPPLVRREGAPPCAVRVGFFT